MELRSLMFWRRPDRCAKCDEYEETIAHLTSIDYKADGVHPTVANAAFDGAAVKLFAASAAHWFKETGGENFVTLEMSDPKTGDHYQLTMQKAGGITPAVKLGRLQERLKKAEYLIRQATPSRSVLTEEGAIDWQASRFEWLSDSASREQEQT